MTVAQIKNGIIAALADKYTEVPVYGDEVPQGFLQPAFFVLATGAAAAKETGRRRRLGADFKVQYFPAEGLSRNEEMYDAGDALIELFEYVDTEDGALRPKGAKYEIADGVLNFYISFKWFALEDEEDETVLAAIGVTGELKN